MLKPKKINFVSTKRIKRLITLFNIFLFIVVSIIVSINKNAVLLNLTMFFVPEILIAIDCLDAYRYFQNIYYYLLAKKFINKNPNLIKIGITGSNGKTSVKNILFEFLKDEYNPVKTAKNFNTPKGIIATINNKHNQHKNCFIFEMGARQRKDIIKLCKLTKINLGCITLAAPQHLETFKNIETIYKTKKELSDYLNKNFCVFNYNNKYTRKMYMEKIGKKSLYGVFCYKAKINKSISILKTECNDYVCNLKPILSKQENKKIKLHTGKKCLTKYKKKFKKLHLHKEKIKIDLIANNIRFENGFTCFNIKYNHTLFKARTSLLGEHNISNILCAMSIALFLGVDINYIIKKIEELKPSEHRLQLIKTDINIIDDSYNCSIESARTALKVLKDFPNKKMVVTPGIVEGGAFQYSLNSQLANMIDSVADYIIIVGETNKNCFKENLKICKNLYFVDSLNQAKQYFSLLKNDDTLLLLNDLPDDYT